MTVLAVQGLTYTYAGAAEPALHDVDLRVEPGEFVVLAGLSASGKSTLLRAASGLVPHFHGGTFAGRVLTGGLDTREHGPADLAAVAGTLFQDPETQAVLGTVRAELAFPLENRGHGPAAVARGVEEAALALGIDALLDRPTHELSGGELQRVALGAALAGRPEVVLLDEPTSQLDPVAGDELIWLLRRLNEEWGTAVLMAEHRLERCLPAADRIVAMEGGRIVFNGAPAEFLDWALEHDRALATPAASLFGAAGLRPLPVSVKQARDALADAALMPPPSDQREAPDPPRRWRRRDSRPAPALRASGLWYEVADGPAVLRGIDLELRPGERVALMGRNGAGKSTFLRLAKDLIAPTRGRIEGEGEIALLMQNPGDYLVHEHVGDEASANGLEAAGLTARVQAHPRDLSGGERQRLALEVVLDGIEPAVVCLDEPTRGMDRAHKDRLAARLEVLAAGGAAVVVATHDTEFAARFAQRVVLMGQGVVIADAPTTEVLSGGWQFATDTARILGEASGALTPEQGAELLHEELVR